MLILTYTRVFLSCLFNLLLATVFICELTKQSTFQQKSGSGQKLRPDGRVGLKEKTPSFILNYGKKTPGPITAENKTYLNTGI